MAKTSQDSLAEALPKAIKRSQELLEAYVDIGPMGSFGAGFIRRDIDEAVKALASGDVVRMIGAFKALNEHS